MQTFAALLDALVYAPQRNTKLALIENWLRTTPDPDRGWGLAALTGQLAFPHAKPALIRALVETRVDPVLFALSYDFVGDLAGTAALIWPTPAAAAGPTTSSLRHRHAVSTRSPHSLGQAGARGGYGRCVVRLDCPMKPKFNPNRPINTSRWVE